MVYIAASYDAPISLAYLLDQKADLNIIGGLYYTALQASCIFGKLAIGEQLLKHGARVDIYGGSMGSCLIAACQGPTETAILQQIIDAGCNVNYMGGDGFCALYTAIKQQKREFVELLTKNGADVNVRDCGPTENLLQCACEIGNFDIVKLLLESKADWSFEGGTYGNALQAACYASQPQIVKLLMDSGMSPNINGGSYVYPLFRVSYENEVAVVKMLLDLGADPNISAPREGFWVDDFWVDATPWEYTSTLEIVKLLLDAGVPIDHQTKTIGTGLARALAAGNVELFDFFLEKGCNVFDQDADLGTMLSCAVRSGNNTLFDRMLDAGLNVNEFLESQDSPTSLHVTCGYSIPSIVENLLSRARGRF